MEVVGPDGVDAAPAALAWPDQLDMFSLSSAIRTISARRRRSRTRAESSARMWRRAVVDDRVGRVEPESVDVVLADPVAGVVDDELAHHAAVRTVELIASPQASGGGR